MILYLLSIKSTCFLKTWRLKLWTSYLCTNGHPFHMLQEWLQEFIYLNFHLGTSKVLQPLLRAFNYCGDGPFSSTQLLFSFFFAIVEDYIYFIGGREDVLYNQFYNLQFSYLLGSSVTGLAQFSSVAQSCPTLCNPMDCSTPGFPVHHQLLGLLKVMSIESVMPSNHLILYHPLLLLASNLSQHQGLFK